MERNGSAGAKRDDTHETPVFDSLRTRISEIGQIERKPLRKLSVALLTHRFGLGDKPAVRRALYRKIEACCARVGRPASKIVWSAIHRSGGKSNPGRWFCVVVIDELQSSGLLDDA